MKLRRRGWMVAVALLVAGLAGFGWWWNLSMRPVVRFAGFRDVGGGRVAAFVVENRSGAVVVYMPSVGFRSERTALMKVGAYWDARDSASGLVIGTPRGPDRLSEFMLPLVIADGETLTTPFQVRVEYEQAPSGIWRHPPLAWLPASLRKPQMKTVWSEVVRP